MKNGKFTDWFVKTFLTDTDNGKSLFETEEEVRENIDERNLRKIDC